MVHGHHHTDPPDQEPQGPSNEPTIITRSVHPPRSPGNRHTQPSHYHRRHHSIMSPGTYSTCPLSSPYSPDPPGQRSWGTPCTSTHGRYHRRRPTHPVMNSKTLRPYQWSLSSYPDRSPVTCLMYPSTSPHHPDKSPMTFRTYPRSPPTVLN